MADVDNRDGSMLALYPPPNLARALAIPGGLPPSELHVTVAYTGKAADIASDRLSDAAAATARAIPALTPRISGHARFTGGEQDVIVALLDSHDLDMLRRRAETELAVQSIAIPRDHGYTAHMTLAYVDPDDPDPVGRMPARPVSFTSLHAVHGGNATAYPFADVADLPDLAREAYAAGWALSGGPMTDRVRAGAIAAVHTALDHAGDPRVLEATLQIGKLEGTLARYFQRRADLTKTMTGRIRSAWNAIARDLHPATEIRRLRAEVSTTSHAPDMIQAAAMGAAAGLLSGVYAHDRHSDFQAAVQDALRAAMAEGRAGDLALHAERHGHTVEDSYGTDAAYLAIYRQLRNLPDLTLMAQDWIQRLLSATGAQIGQLIARMISRDASPEQIAQTVAAELVADEDGSTIAGRAVAALTDQAMAGAMSRSSLDLYQSEGTDQVWYVTAGDGRVCPICEQNEDGSPYAPADCPVPGEDTHPFCRCMIVPDDPHQFSALAGLLG